MNIKKGRGYFIWRGVYNSAISPSLPADLLCVWEFVEFVTLSKDNLAPENHFSFGDICMHLKTRFFSKYLLNYIEFSKLEVLLSTTFKKKSGTFNEALLTLSSLKGDIFQKGAAFCIVTNLKFKRVATWLVVSFCTIKKNNNNKKNRNSEAAVKGCSGKKVFWYSRQSAWKELWRGSFSIK